MGPPMHWDPYNKKHVQPRLLPFPEKMTLTKEDERHMPTVSNREGTCKESPTQGLALHFDYT